MSKDTTQGLPARIRTALRKEFTDFFTKMRTEEPGWPAIPDQQFIEALADSLIASSKASGNQGVAFLQTLVHELQDRINNELKG
jgi:hypothetical protein